MKLLKKYKLKFFFTYTTLIIIFFSVFTFSNLQIDNTYSQFESSSNNKTIDNTNYSEDERTCTINNQEYKGGECYSDNYNYINRVDIINSGFDQSFYIYYSGVKDNSKSPANIQYMLVDGEEKNREWVKPTIYQNSTAGNYVQFYVPSKDFESYPNVWIQMLYKSDTSDTVESESTSGAEAFLIKNAYEYKESWVIWVISIGSVFGAGILAFLIYHFYKKYSNRTN